jgi:hypothetical protein
MSNTLNTLVLLACGSLMLFACSETNKEKYSECYYYASDRDTISMAFNISGDQVKGQLDYHLFDKRQDTGPLKGYLRGDTLFGEFKFKTDEKKDMTREVMFIKGDGFYKEGYGDLVEVDGKLVFENSLGLNFGHDVKLQKQDCK